MHCVRANYDLVNLFLDIYMPNSMATQAADASLQDYYGTYYPLCIYSWLLLYIIYYYFACYIAVITRRGWWVLIMTDKLQQKTILQQKIDPLFACCMLSCLVTQIHCKTALENVQQLYNISGSIFDNFIKASHIKLSIDSLS